MRMKMMTAGFLMFGVALFFFAMGMIVAVSGFAAPAAPSSGKGMPERAQVDFDGASIEGEIRNPGELYFQRRPEEKFDSLVKRRKNFHREMLRDVVMSK
jgi:hypothetical protein